MIKLSLSGPKKRGKLKTNSSAESTFRSKVNSIRNERGSLSRILFRISETFRNVDGIVGGTVGMAVLGRAVGDLVGIFVGRGVEGRGVGLAMVAHMDVIKQ